MVQQVKELALSLQWLGTGLTPGPGTFTCHGHSQKKRKERKAIIRALKRETIRVIVFLKLIMIQ